MPSTVIDRRGVLALLAATATLLPGVTRPDPHVRSVYLVTGPDAADGYRLAAVEASGSILYTVPLPGRAHAVALRPKSNQAVVMARRPARFALVFERRTGARVGDLSAPDGRHFYGHAVYSRDGRTLYTTENAFETGQGKLGVWAADRGYRRVGELPSHGIGPHDIDLMPDGRTLVVANGGVRTHPDSGRAKLNLPAMAPSLAYVDCRTGALVDEARLPRSRHQLGIRHLARSGSTVAFAMQWEGDPTAAPPLLGLHRPGRNVSLLSAPAAAWRRFRGYAGDVAFSRSGRTVGLSGPRGGVIGFWSVPDGQWIADVALPDGCALAAAQTPDGFVAASGFGELVRIEPRAGKVHRLLSGMPRGAAWDNHMSALGEVVGPQNPATAPR